MSPKEWGPPTWILFHSLVHKMKDEKFSEIGLQIFDNIKRICKYLPCPECSEHSSMMLSKIKFTHIKSKQEFINLIYLFHNMVNKRKNKPMYPVLEIGKYDTINLINVFNNFVNVYKTKNNMKLLTDNTQRQYTIKYLKEWITKYKDCFDF